MHSVFVVVTEDCSSANHDFGYLLVCILPPPPPPPGVN